VFREVVISTLLNDVDVLCHDSAHDGIFSQSNFGIVTKMVSHMFVPLRHPYNRPCVAFPNQGMHLMPNPGGIQVLKVTFPKEEDMITVIDILRPMMQRHIIGNIPVLRTGLTEALTYKTKADFGLDERGVITREEETKFYKDLNSGTLSSSPWVRMYLTLDLNIRRRLELVHDILWP
jgi:hypothetical protein